MRQGLIGQNIEIGYVDYNMFRATSEALKECRLRSII